MQVGLKYIICFYLVSILHHKRFKLFYDRRQRQTSPGNSPWELVLESLNSSVSTLQIDVINRRTKVLLQLQLVALADSTLRFQLDEVNPIKPRYRVEQSLASEPIQSGYVIAEIFIFLFFFNFYTLLIYSFSISSLLISEQTADTVSVTFGQTGKAVLSVKPFRMDVFEGGRLVMSVNARGLLNFEHQRSRKSK